MAYGLTDEEQARLNSAPWPYRLEVARQLDAERQERDRQARQLLLNARYEETLAYAAHTRRRSDEETRKHAAGLPCDDMFCRYDHAAAGYCERCGGELGSGCAGTGTGDCDVNLELAADGVSPDHYRNPLAG